MKSLAAFALVVLSCAPAIAQRAQPQTQSPGIESELLEMAQDVDKTILREALMLQARQGMKPEANLPKKDADALREFIAKKKGDIIARAADVRKSRVPGMRGPNTVSRAATTAEQQDVIEKIEKAQIETQLLQVGVNLLQPALTKAINALATAELAMNDDETQKAKVDEARKEYEKIKAKYVDASKRLQLEQQELQLMQQSIGMRGMGGGFR